MSDLHFGREPTDESRTRERTLIRFLEHHENVVSHLFLLGDVFEDYIEYKHLVRKGYVRFQALLAEWTDRGIPVTYLVGNHDPWHQDYYREELGIRIVFDSLVEQLGTTRLFMVHGDGIDPASRFYRRLKPLLRHRWPVSLYRGLLPGDSGVRLARFVNQHIGDEVVRMSTVEALRRQARHLLVEHQVDAVLMGHSHHPEWFTWPEGAYINTGCWYDGQTFACNDTVGLRLCRWDTQQSRAISLRPETL